MERPKKDEPSRRAHIRIPDNWASMSEAEQMAVSLQMAKEIKRMLQVGRSKTEEPGAPEPPIRP